nr:proline-rich receptor-like protein kinase PERK1 [Tanacetum cinerariifolium]
MSQVVRALEGDVSLSDLDEGIKLGHNSVYNGSSDYDTVHYNVDVEKFRKMALKTPEYATMSQVVRALEGDVSLSNLDEGIKLGHNSIYNGSSDYDTVQYNVDMDKFRKMALETPEYATVSSISPQVNTTVEAT